MLAGQRSLVAQVARVLACGWAGVLCKLLKSGARVGVWVVLKGAA